MSALGDQRTRALTESARSGRWKRVCTKAARRRRVSIQPVREWKKWKRIRLSDGAKASGGGAEVREGGLGVDAGGGFVVGHFADVGMAAVDAEVLADLGEDFGGEGEEGGSGAGGLEMEVRHCVLHGGR
jgi:hypothetical protein